MSTIILQSEESLVIEVVETDVASIVETEVETVLVVQDTEVIVFEVAEPGPPGPPGPPGSIDGTPVAGSIDLIYTGEKLTRVDMPNGTHKLLSYVGDLLTRVDHVKTGSTVRRDMVYGGGRLELVEVSIL